MTVGKHQLQAEKAKETLEIVWKGTKAENITGPLYK